MHYYKYLDKEGSLIQLEATTRIIDTNKNPNVVEISKEEYDELIEEMKPSEEEPIEVGK